MAGQARERRADREHEPGGERQARPRDHGHEQRQQQRGAHVEVAAGVRRLADRRAGPRRREPVDDQAEAEPDRTWVQPAVAQGEHERDGAGDQQRPAPVEPGPAEDRAEAGRGGVERPAHAARGAGGLRAGAAAVADHGEADDDHGDQNDPGRRRRRGSNTMSTAATTTNGSPRPLQASEHSSASAREPVAARRRARASVARPKATAPTNVIWNGPDDVLPGGAEEQQQRGRDRARATRRVGGRA